MAEWRDVTSWTRSDDEEARKTPRTWEWPLWNGRLVVTRNRFLAADEWKLAFNPWGVDLGTTRGTADEAKSVAVSRLRSWLTVMLGGLP